MLTAFIWFTLYFLYRAILIQWKSRTWNYTQGGHVWCLLKCFEEDNLDKLSIKRTEWRLDIAWCPCMWSAQLNIQLVVLGWTQTHSLFTSPTADHWWVLILNLQEPHAPLSTRLYSYFVSQDAVYWHQILHYIVTE